MPARRLAAAIATCLLSLPVASPAEAHRLDEYLLASRIAFENGRVAIELDVTPGVVVAPEAWRWLDGNGDGRVAADELDTRARAVLAALTLSLDGRPLPLTLVDAHAPDRDAIDAGTGVIRLRAAAATGHLKAGHHTLAYANTYKPGTSVYLANAMIPADSRVRIVSQQRDPAQERVTIAFDVAASRWSRAGAAAASVTVVVIIIGARRRRNRSTHADRHADRPTD
jgi:hypothetical protein